MMMSKREIEVAIERLDFPLKPGGPLFASKTEESDEAAAGLRQRFAAHGVEYQALYPEDPRFPDTLKDLPSKDYPNGFVFAGNLDLLDKVKVGICGSRKASNKGLSVAESVCSDLAAEGITIVSGYASGVDESAHRAALSVGGSTICVLAEGLNHFRIKRSLASCWSWDRVLILSQFGFRSIWQASRAMQRNKTIVGLSKATIVVEARDKGGTLDAGLTALRLGKPLLVAQFAEETEESAGNQLLLKHGAIPLRRSRSTGNPSFSELRRILSQGV